LSATRGTLAGMPEDGFPKPCEALIEGEWLSATLMRWYYWPDGSLRAAVRFRRLLTLEQLAPPFGGRGDQPFWFNFERTLRPDELRAAPAASP
jgi:hypothetical protein